MENVDKIYSINCDNIENNSKGFNDDIEKYIDESFEKYKKEAYVDSLKREELYLPFYLRRKNLVKEIPIIMCIIITLISTGIYFSIKNMNDKVVIEETTARVIINNTDIKAKEETITVNERTYVNLSWLCDTLNYTYKNINDDSMQLTSDGKTYNIEVNSKNVGVSLKDSEKTSSKVTLSQKVIQNNGNIYIYIRDLSLFMPINASWNEKENIVIIKTINY